MTFAYFHLPPFVNVSSEGWGGIEPNFNKEFAKKYNLNMEWFDAKYSWGKFVPETGKWNGVVGHTLYGDVDVGMCNIDITHSRYSGAVDYSAFIRSSLSFYQSD